MSRRPLPFEEYDDDWTADELDELEAWEQPTALDDVALFVVVACLLAILVMAALGLGRVTGWY